MLTTRVEAAGSTFEFIVSGSWRAALGRVSARVVRAAEQLSTIAPRPLSASEKSLVHRVFGEALNVDPIDLCEGVTGLVNLSRRAFVIEQRLYVPRSYLPLADSTLVHELTHVWQFQHGGHAYIGDSLHAQTVGDGYNLARALRQGRPWAAMNCEQQATFIAKAFELGCFEGARFVLGDDDSTEQFLAAKSALRAGQGAPR